MSCSCTDLIKVDEYTYRCSRCNKYYFVCPNCGKRFEKLAQLRGHLSRCRVPRELRSLSREVLGVEVSDRELLLAYAVLEQLRLLREVVEMLKLIEESLARISSQPLMKVEVRPERVEGKVTEEELPSFAKDNPWLSVLARRGKEELL